jgi:hypothetical protein
MKTIEALESELTNIRKELEEFKKFNSNYDDYVKFENKKRNRIEFISMCKLYIDTSPRESFIKSELNRLEKRLEKLDGGFAFWFKSSGLTDFKQGERIYASEVGIKKIKEQIKTLSFLLN